MIDIEQLKQLAERTPFYYDIDVSPGEPIFGGRIVANGECVFHLHFTMAGSNCVGYVDDIVKVGVMYMQFNKFMNERFGELVSQYRAKMIE